ncbi:unnamed protein product [Urochloa decumbens]|uniref:Uncharacterized protein n=1 Tax=Urochloa decumbens TaxID=240449 RepID=A0ABC9AD12_9POAL
MRLRRRAAGGDGDPSDAALLAAVGLGRFSRLALPDHQPEELGLAAAYDAASGRIIVSVAAAGASVSASPADIAYALKLPPAPIGLAEGVDAAVFASPEAIAAVRGFVRDRVILGGGGDGEQVPGEVAAALRSVEEGKAYEVDWAGLVWAVVKGEVVAGAPRRYAPYLLLLMERQIPELFSEFDGSLPPPKRWKGLEQQSQWDDVGFLALDEDEEDASLVYGENQNIGDFEDMPIFGKCENVGFVGGEEIHAQSEGDDDLGMQNFSHSDVKLLGRKMECDDMVAGCIRSSAKEDGYLSSQQMIPITQSQPESKPCHNNEIEDEDDNVNVDVGLSVPMIRNAPLGTTSYLQLQQVGGICNYRTPSPFEVCLQQINGYMPAMEGGYLDLQKTCRDTQDEVEHIKKMVMEKDHLFAATKSDILEELRVRNTKMRSLKADMDLMCCDKQKHIELLAKSLAEFQDYSKRIMHGEGVDSYSEVLGISGGQNHAWVQQAHYNLCQKISRIDQTMYSHSSKLLAKITGMEAGMVKLNQEVQRINYSRSIPDLNNGIEDNGEAETSMSKLEEKSCASEGCRVSDTAQAHGIVVVQAGKEPVQLVANPDQRNDSGESMDLNGVQR